MKIIFQDFYLTFYENGLIKSHNLKELIKKYSKSGMTFKEVLNFHLSLTIELFYSEKEERFYFNEETEMETSYIVGHCNTDWQDADWQDVLLKDEQVKFELVD